MDLVLITNPVLPSGEIQTSDGLNIPVGWEPFAYDSKDQQGSARISKIRFCCVVA